ncbi:uncharacterized protein SOCE26_060010 [Sorangium cellulosum]|uniref:Uncharacterized protein n=1 Tax=Sorangium cellulosum TaxID=56 RepID=A0A2L0EZ09_SORCE|nr:uncharacterized protein SOCE26_060010 [Sorangium cellulosum]
MNSSQCETYTHVATQHCIAVLLPFPEGWVAFTPDGRYKFSGDLASNFWHAIHLCRFEPGELDPYAPNLRLNDETPLATAAPRCSPSP